MKDYGNCKGAHDAPVEALTASAGHIGVMRH
jgi:hypothetical protein